MTPTKQKYKKQYSFELLRIAVGDLGSARSLLNANEGRVENLVYLAQQAIEKALKAVLIFYGEAVTHTHDLSVLITILGDKRSPPESEKLIVFSQYATVRRYQEGYEEITKEDLKAAIATAEQIIKWASRILVE